MKFQGRYGFIVRAGIESLTPDCRAVLVGFSVRDTRDWPEFQGSMLEPGEARQLAAALVALADEIAPRSWDADPLKLAIAVIEGYQMEIRNSGGDYGINLEEAGFCQGSIYVDAVERIRKLAKEQP